MSILVHDSGQATGLLSPFLEKARNRQVVKWIGPRDRVLDIGCGRAPLLDHLIRAHGDDVPYVGVDINPQVIASNGHRYPSQSFVTRDLYQLRGAFEPGTFDRICLVAVIEHVEKPDELLNDLRPLLAAKGKILFTAPRRGSETLYELGSRIGIFSHEAAEEHNESFPDRAFFERLATGSGCRLETYRTFLCGFNQLAVFAQA